MTAKQGSYNGTVPKLEGHSFKYLATPIQLNSKTHSSNETTRKGERANEGLLYLSSHTSTPSNCTLWFQWFIKRSVARQACAGVATLRQSSLTQTDGRFTSHPLGSRQNDDFFVTDVRHTPVCLHTCVLNSSF